MTTPVREGGTGLHGVGTREEGRGFPWLREGEKGGMGWNISLLVSLPSQHPWVSSSSLPLPTKPLIPQGSLWSNVDHQPQGPGGIYQELEEGGKHCNGEVTELSRVMLGKGEIWQQGGGENVVRGTEGGTYASFPVLPLLHLCQGYRQWKS